MSALPPLPKGFTVDGDQPPAQASGLPPLPQGFTVDQPAAPPPEPVPAKPMGLREQVNEGARRFMAEDPRAQAAMGIQEAAAALPGMPLDAIYGAGNFLRRQFDLPEADPAHSGLGDIRPWMGQGWIDRAARNGLIDSNRPAPATELGRAARKAGAFGATALASGPGSLLPTATSFVGSEIGRAVDPGGPGETIGAFAGGFTPMAVEQGIARGSQAIKYGLRGSDTTGRLKVIDAVNDARVAGTSPTVGQTGATGFSRYFEGILKHAPGAVGTFKTALEDQAKSIGARITQIADRLSRNADEVSAGQAGLRGVRSFTDSFKNKASRLYSDLDAEIPAQTQVQVASTVAELQKITKPISGAPGVTEITANNQLNKVATALIDDVQKGGGSIPYEGLKQLRTWVGERLGAPSLTNDLPQAQLKALYGALSDDMRAAATAQGASAERAFNRANDFYRAGSKRIDDHLERLAKQGAEPEKVFEALWRGRGGETFIQTVRRSIPDSDWKTVAAAALKRLGDAKNSVQSAAGDVWSSETFLTRWNELSPSAKQAFFGGSSLGTLRHDLDAIARTAERIREQAKVLHNSSGTTPTAVNVGAAATALTAAGTGNFHIAAGIGAAAVLSNVSARLMTNPAFVSWLAKTTSVPATQMPARLGLLTAIAANNPDIRDDVKAYLDGFSATQGQADSTEETPPR